MSPTIALALSVLLTLPLQQDPPGSAPVRAKDRVTVTLAVGAGSLRPAADPDAQPAEPAATASPDLGPGRLILFMIESGRRAPRGEPMEAPFYSNPQPVASLEVGGLKVGGSIMIDATALAWPVAIDDLDGEFRIQALYRLNAAATNELRGHLAPGNVFSETKVVQFSRDAPDSFELVLSQRVPDEPLPEAPNLKWVEIPSKRLSAALGREVMLRCGVVFPKGYDDIQAKRRFWPTIYVIPGFGGDHRMAENYASMLATPGTETLAPQAVYVIPDPNGPYGHHGFVNAEATGPRGDAFVRELIPELEERFRLVAKPEARIVTGHSSGGWSSLWLQLQYPDVFGACFSSAPDPVDFSAFQRTDLYADQNAFTDAEGREQASFRQPLGPEEDRVLMTVREEVGVEHVLGPLGDSGEQWGAWAAMFGTLDPRRGPRWAFDPVTGAIDRAIVEREWSRFDIARLVMGDWKRYGPILAERVRLLCGARDSYYLERAVIRLRDKVQARREADIAQGITPPAGAGYIEIIPRATHETIVPLTTMRWNGEMVDFLKKGGFHD